MKFWCVTSMAAAAVLSSTFVAVAASPARNCTEATAKCEVEGAGKPNIAQKCAAAGARCRQTGVFVGPITGRRWSVPNR